MGSRFGEECDLEFIGNNIDAFNFIFHVLKHFDIDDPVTFWGFCFIAFKFKGCFLDHGLDLCTFGFVEETERSGVELEFLNLFLDEENKFHGFTGFFIGKFK
jgi:hypothetical protein